jgi:hypothetical protein
MFEHLRAYLARPTFFLAAGIAVGALLAPTFGGNGAEAVTTYTRAVSCPGLAWWPVNSDIEYFAHGTERRSNTNSAYFVCNASLPHKAVVTRVRFTLHDSAGGNVNACALVRVGLSTATAGTAQLMAAVGTTTNVDIQRLDDTTISYATVDNANYAYYLQCQINLDVNEDLQGIYGADITYKITAANG